MTVTFRPRALKQFQRPDDLDLLARVTRLRGWLMLGALALVTIGVVIYGEVGSISQEVSAPGLLSMPQGVSAVDSTVDGQILSLQASDNSEIAAGAPIATVQLPDGSTRTINSHWGGHIVGLPIDEGNVVHVGSPLMLIERSNVPNNRLLAFMFLQGSAGSVARGMHVDLNVSSAPSGSYGVLRGIITAVDPFPATPAEVQSLIGNPSLTRKFTAKGPPTIVTVDLLKDAKTLSHYKWSTKGGPPFPIGSGAQVAGTVIQGSTKPIDLVFGK
jgi:multidrug resistance efflux pump